MACWLCSGSVVVDRLASALEGAVHGGDRGVERLGHLARGEAEHLAQDQSRALVGGQVLERRHERQLDALAQLVARLGAGRAVLEAEALVRIGIHPDRLGRRQSESVVRVGGRAVVEREHPLLGPPRDQVEAAVGGDRVEPRAERAAALEPGQPAPGAQRGVLEGVLGVLDRAEHPVAVRVELRAIRLEQAAEGRLVAVAGRGEQLLLLCACRAWKRWPWHGQGSHAAD